MSKLDNDTMKILKEASDYCWSNQFLDIFRQYFTDHAEAFEDAPEISGEQSLEYYSLYQDYLKLYEVSM